MARPRIKDARRGHGAGGGASRRRVRAAPRLASSCVGVTGPPHAVGGEGDRRDRATWLSPHTRMRKAWAHLARTGPVTSSARTVALTDRANRGRPRPGGAQGVDMLRRSAATRALREDSQLAASRALEVGLAAARPAKAGAPTTPGTRRACGGLSYASGPRGPRRQFRRTMSSWSNQTRIAGYDPHAGRAAMVFLTPLRRSIARLKVRARTRQKLKSPEG